MIVLNCVQPTYFDVDETLVIFVPDNSKEPELVEIADPSGKFSVKAIPHKGHIRAIKEHKGRGHTIIVWSAGGHAWAEAVVKALNLQDYVDLVIEKPMWYYDDLPCSKFMGKNIYKENK